MLEADWSSGPRVGGMLRQAPTQHDMTTARSISGACEPSSALPSTAVAPQSCRNSSASNLAGPAACRQRHRQAPLLLPTDIPGVRSAAFFACKSASLGLTGELGVRKQEECCLSLQSVTARYRRLVIQQSSHPEPRPRLPNNTFKVINGCALPEQAVGWTLNPKPCKPYVKP